MGKLDTVKVLKRAGAIISNPKKFCRDVFATNASGLSVDMNDPKATRFCAKGAIAKVAGSKFGCYYNSVPAGLFLDEAAVAGWGAKDPARINNSMPHEETIAMFNLAVALAESAKRDTDEKQ